MTALAPPNPPWWWPPNAFCAPTEHEIGATINGIGHCRHCGMRIALDLAPNDPHAGVSWIHEAKPCNREWPCPGSSFPRRCAHFAGHTLPHRCKCGAERPRDVL